MDILTWAENEFKRSGILQPELQEAFRALVGDDRPNWVIQDEAKYLLRLANWLPLTEITEGDEEDWRQESGIYEDGAIEYICGRYPSLSKTVWPDGTTKCYDDSRFEYYDIDTGCRTFPCGGVTLPVNEVFPITFPYEPQLTRTKVFIKTFPMSNHGLPTTIGIYYAEKPYGEQTDIERWFKWSKKKDDWVEISYVEYILREAFAGV